MLETFNLNLKIRGIIKSSTFLLLINNIFRLRQIIPTFKFLKFIKFPTNLTTLYKDLLWWRDEWTPEENITNKKYQKVPQYLRTFQNFQKSFFFLLMLKIMQWKCLLIYFWKLRAVLILMLISCDILASNKHFSGISFLT